jgi:hypothetical protein
LNNIGGKLILFIGAGIGKFIIIGAIIKIGTRVFIGRVFDIKFRLGHTFIKSSSFIRGCFWRSFNIFRVFIIFSSLRK